MKPTQKTRKYDLKMVKDGNIKEVYTSYAKEQLKLKSPLSSDTIEVKWNKIIK